MNVSRRRFLGAFSASIAAILSIGSEVGGQGRFSQLIGRSALPADALSQLGWSSFYANLNTDFAFSSLQAERNSSRPARLRLVSMKDDDPFRKGSSESESRCFALTFAQSARAAQLGQGTYAVSHTALGRFELFISDASATEGGIIYSAVINRIVE